MEQSNKQKQKKREDFPAVFCAASFWALTVLCCAA